MKSIYHIILLISTYASFASEDNLPTIIWYDGASYYKILDSKKGATIFFSSWTSDINQFVRDKNYKVVLQLDRSLDPLPEDDLTLPSITHLSAINDDQIVSQYVDFLEKYSRTKGFTHLILPDTVGFSLYEKEVIEKMIRDAPYYFISKTHISKTIPKSKKDFETEHPTIWVANQSYDTKKLFKWSKKYSRDYDQSFYSGLLNAESVVHGVLENLPKGLARQLFEKGVVAIDPHKVLPIREKAVVYRGNDEQLKEALSRYVAVYDASQPEHYPVILDKRGEQKGTIYGNEIVIDFIQSTFDESASTALLVPGTISDDETLISNMLFGAKNISGRLEAKGNRTIELPGFIGYSSPSLEGLDETHLKKIDDLVKEAIQKYATPACQLAIVKNGSIVLEESFGHFTYDSLKRISNETIFDLASLTKVMATLPAVALLIDQGKIDLEDSISQHLPSFEHSNKSDVTIRELLAHNGGLRSYIPFWSMAMDGDRLDAFYYKTAEDKAMDIRTYGVESHPALSDTLKNWIVNSNLIKNPERYNYSDLGFMVLHLLVEAVSGQVFDEFLEENFYAPMNLSIVFNPKEKGFSFENIAPTEYDSRYRNGLVWGEVHDRNAHVFGGIAGHAGLFSHASDLAKMMYMLSNGGYYRGNQYLKKETLDIFNTRYFENSRRGLGWDKKGWGKGTASSLADDSSFGHTGFTGTMVWADPEEDLIFVFLSNRIYPDSNNRKLMELNTRTEIHDVIYRSLLND